MAPQAKTEVKITTPQGTQALFLGTQAGPGLYARLGAQAPVVQVSQTLSGQIAQGVNTLEDRRLFSESIMEVEVAVWGSPGKSGPPSKTRAAISGRSPGRIKLN